MSGSEQPPSPSPNEGGDLCGSKGRPSEPATPRTGRADGLRLDGDAGLEVMRNMRRLAAGQLAIEDLRDPRYGRTADGVLELILDPATYLAINGGVDQEPPPRETP